MNTDGERLSPPATSGSMVGLLRRVWRHVRPRRRVQFGLLFVLMFVASLAELISIGAVLPFLGVLTAPESVYNHRYAQPLIRLLRVTSPEQLLLPLTVLFAAAALLSGVIRFIVLWLQTRVSQAIATDLSLDGYWRTLHQPYESQVGRNSSEVITSLHKAAGVASTTLMPMLTIVSSSMTLVTILAALVTIEPVMACVAFATFGAVYGLVVVVTRKQLLRNSERISLEFVQVVKKLQEALGGIRDVLLDGTQRAYLDIYRNTDVPLRRAQANVSIISNSPRFGIEAIGMILVAGLAYSLALREDGLANSIPVLGAMALGAQRLLPVLQQTYASWAYMRGSQGSLVDVLQLLEQPLPANVGVPPPVPLRFARSLTLDNLSFKYGARAPWVLRGVSLTIPKGSRIGVIGSTGSGKSTLLDIVMGLLRPTEGQLLVDGVAVSVGNERAWQLHVAHVPQSIFLTDATVAENIAFGLAPEQIDLDRVRLVAGKAQIADVIESWGDGYRTLVGERGVRLSGGQRQRIGIARALYKRADVIIFDEATSSLDTETERAVMQSIDSLGEELTVIIVAHRLSTLKKCTRVVELVGGQIVNDSVDIGETFREATRDAWQGGAL